MRPTRRVAVEASVLLLLLTVLGASAAWSARPLEPMSSAPPLHRLAAAPEADAAIPLQDSNGNGVPDVDKNARYSIGLKGTDTDGDGIPDAWEIHFGLDPNNPGQAGQDPAHSGMSILEKYQWSAQHLAKANGTFDPALGLDPRKADTNGDGLPDGWKVRYGLDPLGPNLSGQLTPSGLTFLEAYQAGTDPTKYDTVGNGLSDFEKIHVYHTSPLKWSTVGDGISDGDKVHKYHLDPRVRDTDGDGLTDCQEVLDTALAHCTDSYHGPHDGGTHTDPHKVDSSVYGGIPDGRAWSYWMQRMANCTRDAKGLAGFPAFLVQAHPGEGPALLCARYGPLGTLLNATDAQHDPLPNILNPDVANSKMTNGRKLALNLDLANPDTDGDGLPDWWEVKYGTNPLDPNDANATVRIGGGVRVYDRGNGHVAYVSPPSRDPPGEFTSTTGTLYSYTNLMAFRDVTDPNRIDTSCDGIPDAWKSFFHDPGPFNFHGPRAAPHAHPDPAIPDSESDFATDDEGRPTPSGYDADHDNRITGDENLTVFEKWYFSLDPTHNNTYLGEKGTDGQRLWNSPPDEPSHTVGLRHRGATELAAQKAKDGCDPTPQSSLVTTLQAPALPLAAPLAAALALAARRRRPWTA